MMDLRRAALTREGALRREVMVGKVRWVVVVAALLAAGGVSALESPRLRLTVGYAGPAEVVDEPSKGVDYHVELGSSPVLGVVLAQGLGPAVSVVADVSVAPAHGFRYEVCYLQYGGGPRCGSTASDSGHARTYEYALGLEFGPRGRAVRPHVGLDLGGVTYAYSTFGEGQSHTRRLWSLRGGLAWQAGQHALALEGRWSAVSKPPWGHESLHPFELRAGLELALGGCRP